MVYPQKFLITHFDEEVKLKSLSMTLLVCLIENQGNAVSKNELMEKCWSGRVVTDDAVRQAIKELRSVLGCKNDGIEYIQTVRKQGYRLVPEIEHTPITKEKTNAEISYNFMSLCGRYKFLLLAVLCSFIFIFVLSRDYSHSYQLSKESTVITYDKKREDDYGKSIEGWDAFVVLRPDFYFGEKIIIRDSNKVIKHKIAPGKENGHLGNLTFSPNGQLIAYLDFHPDSCKIQIINVKTGDKVRSIECQKSDLFIALDWYNNYELYFSTSPNDSTPLELRSFNLKDGRQRLITTPPKGGRGDYFSRSCGNKNHFILRNLDSSTTKIVQYDATKKQEKFIISIPEILPSADWLPDCKSIVLYLNGRGLYSLSINTGVLSRIDENIKNVKSLKVNGEYLYVAKGRRFNKSIVSLDTSSNPLITPIILSNASNIFYTKSSTTDAFVFISTRTGRPQVWLSQNEKVIKLTSFPYVIDEKSLSWSFDGKTIFLAEGKNIWEIDVKTFESKKIHESNGPVNGLVSINENEWLYSSYEDNLWQGFILDIESNKRSTISNLSIKDFKKNKNNSIFFRTQHDDIYKYIPKGDANKKITTIDANCADWTILGELVYCVGDGELKRKSFDRNDMTIIYQKVGVGERFFVENSNKFYLEKTNSGTMDIYQYTLKSSIF